MAHRGSKRASGTDDARTTLCSAFVPLVATSEDAVSADNGRVPNVGDAVVRRSCVRLKLKTPPTTDATIPLLADSVIALINAMPSRVLAGMPYSLTVCQPELPVLVRSWVIEKSSAAAVAKYKTLPPL